VLSAVILCFKALKYDSHCKAPYRVPLYRCCK